MNTAAILAAIREVLDGTGGAIRVVDEGTLDVGQPGASEANKALALTRPVYDIEFGAARRDAASPFSVAASRAIKNFDVTIRVTWSLPSNVETEARYQVRADAYDLAETVAQALGWPGNLATSGDDSAATGLVSGMLYGPGDEPIPTVEAVSEDWETQTLVFEIAARALVVVSQPITEPTPGPTP